jgi:hypothetical protein
MSTVGRGFVMALVQESPSQKVAVRRCESPHSEGRRGVLMVRLRVQLQR